MMRLNKFIANSGYCSRRKADDFISSGRVKVNNIVVDNHGYRVKENDEVSINGQILELEEKVYYMLNKPVGYMSSVEDPNFDKFVIDLIPEKKRIYPVGRLDVDSRGLLLLTNDGEITNKLTHPSYQVDKVYRVKINHRLTKEDINKLQDGIIIDDGSPVRAIINEINDKRYEFIIDEGRNRQIRKMIMSIGKEVEDLFRIQVGPIKLGQLKEGSYRKLSRKEIIELKEI